MVANHARKKQARALIAESRGKLSYLEALGYAQELPELYPKGHPGLSIRGRIKSVTLTRLPDGEVLGIGSSPEDWLVALRFSTSKIHERMKTEEIGNKALLVEVEMEPEHPDQPELSKFEKEARVCIESLDYFGAAVGVYLSVTPRDALVSIDSEEQANLALVHMEKTGKSYEKALIGANRLLALRPTIQEQWKSKLQDPAIVQAKEALRSGRDLVIYGYAATGKSTACYAVLGALESQSLLLENSTFHLDLVSEYVRGLPVAVAAKEFPGGLDEPKLEGIGFLALDEPHHGISLEGVSPSIGKILTVHAGTSDDASRRLASLIPGLKLADPIFLASRGEPDRNGDFTRWLEIDSKGAN